VYDGNGTTCIPNPCPEPTGACCLNSGVCVVTTQADCTVQAGIYQGTDTVCAPDLCPVVLEPFVDALPLPGVAQPDTGVPGGQATYTIPITEFWQKLHRDLPPTRVWGYGGSYPGPTIVASVGQPVMVTWVNDLRDENGVPRTTHYLPVDLCPDGAANEPRVVAHLHGGHVPPESDGYPEAWFLPGQSATTAYPNEQLPSTIWYHDHAMGMTRLNVYMGLAGFYLITDVFEQSLGLPEGAHEAGLAIQDRWFNPDGTLKYMEMWDEHFFGDKMLVNGKVWPYFEVDRGKYRFRMLNGCNSRVLTLALSDGASFWLIGMEGGLLPAPVPLTQITIGPGERADVVMDFAAHEPAAEVLLTNSAPAPFPGTPGEGVIPNVMKFIVTAASGHTAPLPATLRPMEVIPESSAVRSRELVLRKQSDACTGQAWLINGLHWMDITEVPHLGTVEIWNFINRSGVSHPMHLHLVMFQVLDRQPFEVVSEQIVPTGPRVPAPPGEGGWKDTVLCPPNEITRVITRFEGYAGLYPYHCHILEHEDHEMMRQFRAVVPSDLNEDGYVDESDVELFKLCTSRATVPVAPGCESSDLDGDGDADQNDFGLLQRCYGGANQPPPHGCSG